MFARPIAAAFAVAFWASPTTLSAQLATPTPDAVRVTVSTNADGTAPHHLRIRFPESPRRRYDHGQGRENRRENPLRPR
jgi:hypothetical protein